jgi:hypothetical protein
MSIRTDPRACPGCGLELPELDASAPADVSASPACWALYGRLLVAEYGQAASPRLHRLTVDTYAVQHPARSGCRSIRSLVPHLIGLCLALEREASARHAPRLLDQTLEWLPSLRWLEAPVPNGTITIADAVSFRNLDERARRIEQWATNVWDAWSLHHATVRGWIE